MPLATRKMDRVSFSRLSLMRRSSSASSDRLLLRAAVGSSDVSGAVKRPPTASRALVG